MKKIYVILISVILFGTLASAILIEHFYGKQEGDVIINGTDILGPLKMERHGRSFDKNLVIDIVSNYTMNEPEIIYPVVNLTHQLVSLITVEVYSYYYGGRINLSGSNYTYTPNNQIVLDPDIMENNITRIWVTYYGSINDYYNYTYVCFLGTIPVVLPLNLTNMNTSDIIFDYWTITSTDTINSYIITFETANEICFDNTSSSYGFNYGVTPYSIKTLNPLEEYNFNIFYSVNPVMISTIVHPIIWINATKI